MEKKTLQEKEVEFEAIVAAEKPDVKAAIAIINEVPATRSLELAKKLVEKLTESFDFAGTLFLLMNIRVALEKAENGGVSPMWYRDTLKSATKDRLIASFVDASDFGVRPLADSLARVERLLSFTPKTLVLSAAWGLGEVKRLDYFYRKITVDFRGHHGQQLTFQTACETLTIAPQDHVLVLQKADPDGLAMKIKDQPGDFVKLMVASYGPLTQIRLEDLMVANGFVKKADYKAFWERARVALKSDKLVELPARKSDAIRVKAAADDYGDVWLNEFKNLHDPKEILSAVRLLESLKGDAAAKHQVAADKLAEAIEDRLDFAVKAARGVKDDLYAQLACQVMAMGLPRPSSQTMREYLWTIDRYLEAAKTMPARENSNLVEFLSNGKTDAAARDRLLEALPRMCFQFLTAVVEAYRDEPPAAEGQPNACEVAAVKLLKQPQAPATLVTYVLGRYDSFKNWQTLPTLLVILGHAIALGEGRQSGEKLRMQNIVRRLFADPKWLKDTTDRLSPHDRVSFFERFQASLNWDPSTHQTIVRRMVNNYPELAQYVTKPTKKTVQERVTSFRSYAEYKALYLKLINEDMPENVRKIEFAKGFGDLSENAEYQYAKDEQRQLMQKQALMQAELEAVKATNFANVEPDAVKPGVTVVLGYADGSEKVYSILGEWDNAPEKNILASKTRLAQSVMGHKPGDAVKVPGLDGAEVDATVKMVRALDADVVEWAKLPAGMSI